MTRHYPAASELRVLDDQNAAAHERAHKRWEAAQRDLCRPIDLLRAYRTAAGLSSAQLARRIHMPWRTVRRYLAGTEPIPDAITKHVKLLYSERDALPTE